LYNQADAWAHLGGANAGTYSDWHWWPWGDFWTNFATTAADGYVNPALGTPNKMVICPSEPRNLLVQYESFYPNNPKVPIAFTEYLGVDGIQGNDVDPGGTFPIGDKSGVLINSQGIFDASGNIVGAIKRKVNFASITDGTSNTLAVGERPPSADLYYGWWFAGAGFDGSGEGDIMMGARAVNYANHLATIVAGNYTSSCPLSYVHFKPGRIDDGCDQVHFWSWHPAGANFLWGDGSAKFLQYAADDILPQLCTRNGGEVVSIDY
jgi:prepilin-type processing-associated H-X9-DG protein